MSTRLDFLWRMEGDDRVNDKKLYFFWANGIYFIAPKSPL